MLKAREWPTLGRPRGSTVAPGSLSGGAGSSSDLVVRAASLLPQQKALSWLDRAALDAEQSYGTPASASADHANLRTPTRERGDSLRSRYYVI